MVEILGLVTVMVVALWMIGAAGDDTYRWIASTPFLSCVKLPDSFTLPFGSFAQFTVQCEMAGGH